MTSKLMDGNATDDDDDEKESSDGDILIEAKNDDGDNGGLEEDEGSSDSDGTSDRDSNGGSEGEGDSDSHFENGDEDEGDNEVEEVDVVRLDEEEDNVGITGNENSVLPPAPSPTHIVAVDEAGGSDHSGSTLRAEGGTGYPTVETLPQTGNNAETAGNGISLPALPVSPAVTPGEAIRSDMPQPAIGSEINVTSTPSAKTSGAAAFLAQFTSIIS